MLRGVAISTSELQAQSLRLQTLAANLANVDTPGYRQDQVVSQTFEQLLLDRLGKDAETVGSLELATVLSRPTIDLTPGPVESTGRALDVALTGPGFFVVQAPDGLRYTRHGAFRQDAEGRLVSIEGWPVLGQNGPIAAQDPLRIDSSGRVLADDQAVGQLQVVTFAPETVLARRDGTYLVPEEDGAGTPVAEPEILAGYIEGSNVDLTTTMTELMAATRAYQAAQRALLAHDETLTRLIQQAGQS